MPWDIQMGITQKMAHAPIRFSLTAQYLNRWKFDYIDNTDKEYEGDSLLRRWRSILSSAWIYPVRELLGGRRIQSEGQYGYEVERRGKFLRLLGWRRRKDQDV